MGVPGPLLCLWNKEGRTQKKKNSAKRQKRKKSGRPCTSLFIWMLKATTTLKIKMIFLFLLSERRRVSRCASTPVWICWTTARPKTEGHKVGMPILLCKVHSKEFTRRRSCIVRAGAKVNSVAAHSDICKCAMPFNSSLLTFASLPHPLRLFRYRSNVHTSRYAHTKSDQTSHLCTMLERDTASNAAHRAFKTCSRSGIRSGDPLQKKKRGTKDKGHGVCES